MKKKSKLEIKMLNSKCKKLKNKNNLKKLEAMSKAVVKPKAVPKKLPTVVPTEPTEVEIPEKRAFPSSHTVANALKYQ